MEEGTPKPPWADTQGVLLGVLGGTLKPPPRQMGRSFEGRGVQGGVVLKGRHF